VSSKAWIQITSAIRFRQYPLLLPIYTALDVSIYIDCVKFIGLTNRSTLFTLHRHELKREPRSSDPYTSRAALALYSITSMVLDRKSHDFPKDTWKLSIWTVNCVHLAALAHIQHGDRGNMESWTSDLNLLKSTLKILSRRWKLAGMTLISNCAVKTNQV
jgi:hypothetical protein